MESLMLIMQVIRMFSYHLLLLAFGIWWLNGKVEKWFAFWMSLLLFGWIIVSDFFVIIDGLRGIINVSLMEEGSLSEDIALIVFTILGAAAGVRGFQLVVSDIPQLRQKIQDLWRNK